MMWRDGKVDECFEATREATTTTTAVAHSASSRRDGGTFDGIPQQFYAHMLTVSTTASWKVRPQPARPPPARPPVNHGRQEGLMQ